MHVVVIGSGIAGSSVARCARTAGHRVTVVSAGRENSRAAAAVLRGAYHRRRQLEVAQFARSLALYGQWGVDVQPGAWVTNYRTPGKPPHHDTDWYLLDPAAPLVEPDIAGRAMPHNCGVLVHDVCEIDADAVIWCPGAKLGDVVTYGVTWVHDDPRALTQPDLLRIHHIAPYKTLAAGVVGGHARLGSSSAGTEDLALLQAHRMLHVARDVGIIRDTAGWQAVAGKRTKTDLAGQTGIHHGLGGLHRTGYALAPARAERLVSTLR